MRKIITIIALALAAAGAGAQETKYQETNDISYISPGDTSAYRRARCKLDIYRPANAARPFKTVV